MNNKYDFWVIKEIIMLRKLSIRILIILVGSLIVIIQPTSAQFSLNFGEENTHVLDPITFFDSYGRFSFTYHNDWIILSEEYWQTDEPIKYDYRLVFESDNSVFSLHLWENRISENLAEIAKLHLEPFLSTKSSEMEATIDGNRALVAITPGTPDKEPTVVHTIFRCANNVYRLQYVGYNEKTSIEPFKTLLTSFHCDTKVETHTTNISLSFNTFAKIGFCSIREVP